MHPSRNKFLRLKKGEGGLVCLCRLQRCNPRRLKKKRLSCEIEIQENDRPGVSADAKKWKVECKDASIQTDDNFSLEHRRVVLPVVEKTKELFVGRLPVHQSVRTIKIASHSTYQTYIGKQSTFIVMQLILVLPFEDQGQSC